MSCLVAPIPPRPNDGFIESFFAIVDAALMRALGGERLSGEMLVILAHVVFDDYELFPSSGKGSDAGSKLH
jgi:hypothetical protein